MAKLYHTGKNEIYWSDCEIVCPLEEEYFELSDFIAVKRLDGHDKYDQWYMLVHAKMGELIDLLNQSPIDEMDGELQPLY